MKVSVITPVYNAAEFVTRAVESALAQHEVAEVLLIEDGSPDNSLAVCQELAAKYDKVRLLRHPNGENRGAGASRNLGMQNANCEYIAFLDADDYYLPGRFTRAMEVFESDLSCEGVYEAIGMHVDDDAAYERWKKSGKSEITLHTVNTYIKPENLADALMTNQYGSFSIDGLTIRKGVLRKSGLMNETLKLHQDTDFIIRTAITALLLPGNCDQPVAMWRVHNENRSSSPRQEVQKLEDRLAMWEHLYLWCNENNYKSFSHKIIPYIIINVISEKRFPKKPVKQKRKKILRLKQLFSWLLRKPRFVFDKAFWGCLISIISESI